MKSLDDIPDRYVLVDYQNTLWKSWMVKPAGEEMHRADGHPSGHVFRMFRTLHKWKRDFGGDLVIAHEGGEKLRYELFPEYKANRHRVRVDQAGQPLFDPNPDVARMMSYIKCVEVKAVGAEADDAIAAWVTNHPDATQLIISSDKDLWALRSPRVSIVSFQDMLSDEHVAKTLTKHYGTPNLKSITLAKALFGDKSDGIPGVPRLLRKHMASYLEAASTPDELFDKLYLLPKKTASRLVEHKSQIYNMYNVVSLRSDVTLKYRVRKGDPDGLRAFLEEFECTTLLPYVEFMTL